MKLTHKTLSLAFLLASLLAVNTASAADGEELATTAEENPWEFILSVAPVSHHMPDPGYDLVSGNDWLTTALLSLEFEIWEDFFIAPAYFIGSSTAELNKQNDAKFGLEGWELRLKKGFQILSWLRPYAVVAGTYNWYSLAVTRDSGSDLKHEDGFLSGRFGGRGGLGAEFMIPRHIMASTAVGEWLGGFTVGLGLEAGYSYRPSFELDELKPSAPAGAAAAVPLAPVDMGSMDLGGWYWSLDFRFLF